MNVYFSRLSSLREEMAKEAIDYYIIPTDDFHASEYVGDYFKCRKYVSGFTGSAGVLVVAMEEAKLWTDGRYFIQAEEQLEGSGITLCKAGEPGVLTVQEYLFKNMADNQTLGYDGRTVTVFLSQSFHRWLNSKNIKFKTDIDLVDRIWTDRPPMSHNPIWLLEDHFTGKTRNEKLKALRSELENTSSQGILLTALDEIAWLYNYRGSDVKFTPVAMAYSLVTMDTATLYISWEAVSEEVREAFAADNIELKPYFQIYEDLKDIESYVFVDRRTTNEVLYNMVAHPVHGPSPLQMMKAVKTSAEIHNEKLAHIKDALAMTKAIFRIKCLDEREEIYDLTELDISDMLYDLRSEQDDFLDLSFDSIVATGEHGAIIHYTPTEESDAHITDGLLLIDSGAHYLQGTTDITRTISIGRLTEKQRQCYTAVLKGHLSLASTKFPINTCGNSLDAIARRPIWDLGYDYNHGTGHGVGYLLSVHEGPNSIRKASPNIRAGVALEEGMITSNEPGVYLEGEFGVRIENLILCKTVENGLLGFESLTLVPYDRDAIIPEMLTEEERKLLNHYHHRVFELLSPYLSYEEIQWLEEETFAI